MAAADRQCEECVQYVYPSGSFAIGFNPEFSVVVSDKKDFKKHNDLPIARIKRIMKSDQDVRMIAAETPVLFARACEMFIMDLTIRSSQFADVDNDRLILSRDSIRKTIQTIDIFDFLVSIWGFRWDTEVGFESCQLLCCELQKECIWL